MMRLANLKTDKKEEGYVGVDGGCIWYQALGSSRRASLVLLHGGPGYPHYYLQPLEEFANSMRVVFYDQLGCGKSDRSDAPGVWLIDRFVDELDTLISFLGLRSPILFGHSWGSILALEYYLRCPEKVSALVLASPCLSIPRWVADSRKLRKLLPDNVRSVLDAHERSGTIDAPEYRKATAEYYRQFVCRLRPKPDAVCLSDAQAGGEVYTAMWGANEFIVSGSLAGYDITSRLNEVKVPVLYGTWTLKKQRLEPERF